MNKEKTYVGSGRKAADYDIVNISVCLTDIPKEEIFDGTNGKKYIKLTVAAKKEPDQWGKTHYVAIDDFKPEKKEEAPAAPAAPAATEQGDSDLPF